VVPRPRLVGERDNQDQRLQLSLRHRHAQHLLAAGAVRLRGHLLTVNRATLDEIGRVLEAAAASDA